MSEPFHPVASLDTLAPGSMREIEIDDTKILLVRVGDEITAIDAVCPHAGGPLADGVLKGNEIFCPWHKAAFCVSSGRCLEPPAVDDLRRFPVQVRDGRVFVSLSEEVPAKAGESAADSRTFLIVGAGAAGFSAAQTLRQEGFGGRIVLISREQALPYDRTILSKYVLAGTEAGEKTPLQDEEFYRRNAIERLHAEVTALRPDEKSVLLKDGRRLTYDAALIATGGEPIRPPFPGADLGNVFLLRSQEDAARIVAAASGSRHAVIVGGGFIGLEAAGSLRERGLEVTVIVNQEVPPQKQFGKVVGGVLLDLHKEKGVAFRLGRKLVRLEGEHHVARAVLDDGESLPADLVIAGLGVRPTTAFVDGLVPADDGGLTADNTLKVAEGLYAAGDIVSFPLRGDGPRIRVEHWRVAEQHGRLAALNMLGANRPYDAVPFFWTSHYMQQLDYVGHASDQDQLVVRGDLSKRDFIAYYVREGRVTAAAGLNRDRDAAAVLALMSDRQSWTPDEIHPPDASPVEVLERRQERSRQSGG
ncbi:MAG TPA: FAD-dependent oxidoreductase [Aliidongia sp.]|nr:FAD-dependent oxidoreductase [Aliidongia sp.]